MFSNDEVCDTLKEYRECKVKFHGELMDICREYLNKLSIVSIIGILEIVKQETIELDKATRQDVNGEKSDDQSLI
jgi:hypothetical protein